MAELLFPSFFQPLEWDTNWSLQRAGWTEMRIQNMCCYSLLTMTCILGHFTEQRLLRVRPSFTLADLNWRGWRSKQISGSLLNSKRPTFVAKGQAVLRKSEILRRALVVIWGVTRQLQWELRCKVLIFPQCRRHEGREGTINYCLRHKLPETFRREVSLQKKQHSNTIVLQNGSSGFEHQAVADTQLS